MADQLKMNEMDMRRSKEEKNRLQAQLGGLQAKVLRLAEENERIKR